MLTIAATIRKDDGTLVFQRGGDSICRSPDWRRANQAVRSLRHRLEQIHRREGGTEEDYNRVVSLADQITDLIIPAELREQLARPDEAINWRLTESTWHIPWELLRVGGEFLSLRKPISRMPWLAAEPSESILKSTSVGIVANPEFNLPAALPEADFIHRTFRNRQTTHKLKIEANRVTSDQFRKLLTDSNVFHFAGHSDTTEQDDCPAWKLADGCISLSEVIDRIWSDPSCLVFANACSSLSHPMPTALLQRGDNRTEFGALIGTTLPVIDADSRQLTSSFYEALVGGQSVGSALLQARQHYSRERGANNLLWAAYQLCGNPLLRIETKPECRASSDSPQEATAPVGPALPAKCGECGRTIRTRHGLGTIRNGAPVCRRCNRPETQKNSLTANSQDAAISKVVSYITDQLPLARSLSASEVAEAIDVTMEVVLVAFETLRGQNYLTTDTFDDLGVVISQSFPQTSGK